MRLNEELEKNREEQKVLYTEAFSKNLRNALSNSTEFKSAKQLAEAASISPVMLSAFMTGAKLPTLITAIQLADALNVSLDDLLGRNNEYKSIPAISSQELLVRNLIAMDDAEFIDIKAPQPNDPQYFKLRFTDDDVTKFFRTYYMLSQRLAIDDDLGAQHVNEWLDGEFKKLSLKSIDMKKKR